MSGKQHIYEFHMTDGSWRCVKMKPQAFETFKSCQTEGWLTDCENGVSYNVANIAFVVDCGEVDA